MFQNKLTPLLAPQVRLTFVVYWSALVNGLPRELLKLLCSLFLSTFLFICTKLEQALADKQHESQTDDKVYKYRDIKANGPFLRFFF